MKTFLLGSLAGVLLLVPSTAGATGVVFRAVGASKVLVPGTLVSLPSGDVTHGGASCPGGTVLGALDAATGGDWDGTYDADFHDFLVSTIKGETPTGASFFTLWVNHKLSSTGACSTTLQQGDDVLFFVDRCVDPQPPDYVCQNPPVYPLGLQAPASAPLGRSVTVGAVVYDASGKATPAAGVTVSGGGASAVTNEAGQATLPTPKDGTDLALTATKAGLVPDDRTLCLTSGSDGRCGSPDQILPGLRTTGLKGVTFAAGQGPRVLAGRAVDASGIFLVTVGLKRRVGSTCSYYSARFERFRKLDCASSPPRFSVGDREDWSYLLPARLRGGRYRIDAAALDRSGNRAFHRLYFRVAGKT